MDLTTYLQSQEAHYHPELHLLGEVWSGPGYHCRILNGTWVHPTRTALDYALACRHHRLCAGPLGHIHCECNQPHLALAGRRVPSCELPANGRGVSLRV